jgi:hypothetical protein
MKNATLKICILLLLLQAAFQSNAQRAPLISLHLENAGFGDLVNAIESATPYHFYFDSAQTNEMLITLDVNNKPVTAVLTQLFGKSDWHFAIDDDMNILITRKQEIHSSLPVGFFDRSNETDSSDEMGYLDSLRDESEMQKLNASLENKLFTIGTPGAPLKKGKATIAGYIKDLRNGEPLVGATLSIDHPGIGVATDQFGYYSLTLPRGRYLLRISSVGMKDTKRQVILNSDGKLNIEMTDYVQSLKSVIVSSDKTSNVKGMQMGVERLNMKLIKQVPVVFGEADVLRTVLTLPGVTSAGEASTGINVRGGSSDQNLILFNGSTVYNPSHLFGFFTSFNPDVVKDVDLYKGSIPEKYGGRLSSVLDISTRDGNSKKFSGSGGIGPLTSRLTLEGPVFNDKTTFLVAGRTTYSDWILKAIPDQDYSNSTASFYDLNLNLKHEMNGKNTFYLTGYLSKDRFRYNGDTLYRYENANANMKWKHNFNNQFYGVFMAGYDRYVYSVVSTLNPINAFNLGYNINQGNFRADFYYSAGSSHTIDFGLATIYYKLNPGSYQPVGNQSLVTPTTLQSEQAEESAVYLGDKFNLSSKISLQGGVRFNIYNYLGPHDVYTYAAGQPLSAATLEDTVHYGTNAFIKTYMAPDFRFSGKYEISENASLKVSYNSLQEYLHLLTQTTSISPTDTWILSDPNIKPQRGDQYSLGYYQNLKSNTIETSVEVYYKDMYHYLDYKSGAQLVMNPHVETDVINTNGKSYGVEFLIKKPTGKLNGWISYTYSRALLKEDDPLAGQLVNNGNYYPADFDRPNNLNIIANYRFSHRFSISTNMVYSTGRPITLPVAVYYLAGSERVYYSERNQNRIPDYFRTDLSLNIEGNQKVRKFKHSSWTLGVYNLTARKNPYSVYFTEVNGVIKGYKLSIFGTAIPFITYNFKF